MEQNASKSVLVSAAIIAKDEEQHIGRLLESLKGRVGQVVLIDTGSSDRTVEIAKAHGAIVIHSPWRNDFSYHRNEAIEACDGIWILICDCDDEIVDTDFAETRMMLASGNVTPVLLVRYALQYPDGKNISRCDARCPAKPYPRVPPCSPLGPHGAQRSVMPSATGIVSEPRQAIPLSANIG